MTTEAAQNKSIPAPFKTILAKILAHFSSQNLNFCQDRSAF
jgi:hypothetical protein